MNQNQLAMGQLGYYTNQVPDNRSILEKAKARRSEIVAAIAQVEGLRTELAQLDRMIAAAEAAQ